MTTNEQAYERLELPVGTDLQTVRKKFAEMHNDYRMRIENAPTPRLKQTFERGLEELKEAYALLNESNGMDDTAALPRTGEIFVKAEDTVAMQPPVAPLLSSEQPQSTDEPRNPEKAAIRGKSGTYIGIAAVVIALVTGGYLLTVRNSSDQLPTSTTSPAQDSTAWEAALAGRNVASYEHYLKQYPTGIFAQVARDSLGISSEELNIEVAGKNSILQQPVLEKTDIQLSNTISEENKVENSAASAKGKIKKWEEKSQWAGIVFSEGLARVDADGKYGYINPEGDVVIPLKYDNGLGFSEGLAGVEIQGKWGYINKEGKIVIAAGYDDAYDFFGDIAEVSLKDKSGVYKQGYINKQGKIIVPVKYATLDRFSEGLSMVSLDNRWGFVDRSGNEVIPLKYHAARDFKNGIAAVYDGKQWFYINKQGECVKNCPD